MPKKSIIAAAALAVSVLILLAASPGNARAEQDTPSYSWEEIKTLSVEKKDELAAWLDRQLGEADEDTAAWLSRAGRDAASAFREANAELQERRRVVIGYIDELRAASGEEWESLKARALAAVEDLKDAHRSARDAAQ